jgi:hypothetical protein
LSDQGQFHNFEPAGCGVYHGESHEHEVYD